ncbi:MAG TPA: hypothetical protein VNA20_00830 [Frankiaceae bacterium]|nr:hypothetical protein [Frankiaceae bacterium]
MLRAVLAALTLGAAVATPAAAGPPHDDHYFDGGCSYYAAARSSADPYTGVLLASATRTRCGTSTTRSPCRT